MVERKDAHEELKKTLVACETRLRKLTGEAKSDERARELGEMEAELKSCRLEVDQLEGKSGDEWLDATEGVTRRLEDLQRNLQLTQDRMEDFMR
jgi:hypothetical protein